MTYQKRGKKADSLPDEAQVLMSEKEQKELEAIKRLMILLLYKLGSSSEEIGAALGVDSSAVRRLLPSKSIKRIVKPTE